MERQSGAGPLGWLDRPWLPALLVSLAVALCYGGSATWQPLEQLVGCSHSEAPGHLLGLWATAKGLWAHGPFVRSAPGLGFPGSFCAHLMDPANLLLFLPGYWLAGGGVSGAALGWNLLHVGSVLVAGSGCFFLGRRLASGAAGAPWAIGALVASFVAGSFLLGHPFMGRTEYLPVAWLPWHLFFLLRWLHGARFATAGLPAGLALGAVVLGGAYLCVFAALFELPLALGLLLAARGRRLNVLGRLAAVAVIALLVAAPAFYALFAHPPTGMVELLQPDRRPGPPLPLGQALWSLRIGPAPDLAPLLDQPPYPGLVALALAVAGAALRPRRAAGWLVLGLWLLLLSLGHALTLGPQGQQLLPVAVLRRAFPALANIAEWSRLGCLLPLPLGMAALHGALALLQRIGRPGPRRLLGAALVAAIVADQVSWPRRDQLPRPVFQARIPADLGILSSSLPPGALLQLPLEVSVGRGIKLEANIYALWQLQHERPISATPGVASDNALGSSALARLAVNRQFGLVGRSTSRGRRLPAASGKLSEKESACARLDAAALHELGFAALVLHQDRPAGSELRQLLEPALGPPDLQQGAVAAWDLGRFEAGPACPLPPVPDKVRMMLAIDRRNRGLEEPPQPGGPPGNR